MSEIRLFGSLIRFERELGIKIIAEKGPFFCTSCDAVVDDDVCYHGSEAATSIAISSSKIREIQRNNSMIDARLFDQELWNGLLDSRVQIFENQR